MIFIVGYTNSSPEVKIFDALRVSNTRHIHESHWLMRASAVGTVLRNV